MTRVAIHPTTLDIKLFKPGLGLQQDGYLVFKNAEDLAERGKSVIEPLAKIILKDKHQRKGRLEKATMMWADIYMCAARNKQLDVPEVIEKVVKNEKVPKPKGIGRGNHNPRIPSFTLTGLASSIKMPTQAEVLALEFNKLYAAGMRNIDIKEVPELVKEMKLPTHQDPMRIFRYYFWLLVRAGVLLVIGEIKTDEVVKQNAERHGFDPSCMLRPEVMTN